MLTFQEDLARLQFAWGMHEQSAPEPVDRLKAAWERWKAPPTLPIRRRFVILRGYIKYPRVRARRYEWQPWHP